MQEASLSLEPGESKGKGKFWNINLRLVQDKS